MYAQKYVGLNSVQLVGSKADNYILSVADSIFGFTRKIAAAELFFVF